MEIVLQPDSSKLEEKSELFKFLRRYQARIAFGSQSFRRVDTLRLHWDRTVDRKDLPEIHHGHVIVAANPYRYEFVGRGCEFALRVEFRVYISLGQFPGPDKKPTFADMMSLLPIGCSITTSDLLDTDDPPDDFKTGSRSLKKFDM
jgi:hypothetical protein